MNGRIGAAALLLALAALSACGAKRDPNMPTEEESQQLNNAAEMLDAGNDVAANEDEAADENGDADSEAADNGAGNDH